MSSQIKVLAFAGSTRRDSFNQKLVSIALDGARQAGADTTYINFKDFPLPLMDEDLEREEGTPENAKKLKEIFQEHDALLIASPEYNSSISPLLKNVIDWVSRPADGEQPLSAFDGKVAALMSASPGGLGGVRGLVHLRSILGSIKVLLLPDQYCLSSAYEAFNEDGRLVDSEKEQIVKGLGIKVVSTALALKSSE